MDPEQPAGQLGGNASAHYRKVQLSEFWPQAPAAWFAATELKFEVAGITQEREKFAHAVGAMTYGMLRNAMDLVETPPEDNPYTTLKGRMVLAHALTPVQKAAKVLQLPSLGNQRPSEMMAGLMEFFLSFSFIYSQKRPKCD